MQRARLVPLGLLGQDPPASPGLVVSAPDRALQPTLLLLAPLGPQQPELVGPHPPSIHADPHLPLPTSQGCRGSDRYLRANPSWQTAPLPTRSRSHEAPTGELVTASWPQGPAATVKTDAGQAVCQADTLLGLALEEDSLLLALPGAARCALSCGPPPLSCY